MAEEDRLEVGVSKRAIGSPIIYYDFVTAYTLHTNQKFIVVAERSVSGKLVERSLSLRDYLIRSITCQSGVLGPLNESFSSSLKDQEEAFELLDDYLELINYVADRPFSSADEEKTKTDSKETGAVPGRTLNRKGPRRIEVLFQDIVTNKQTWAVVDAVIAPDTNFPSYSVSARPWHDLVSNGEAALSYVRRAFNENQFYIRQIKQYYAGSPFPSFPKHFTLQPEPNRESWAYLKESYDQISPADKALARRWVPNQQPEIITSHSNSWKGKQDDDEFGPYHHWTQGPRNYQPTKGYFRVSGDKLGIETYAKQKAKQTKHPLTFQEMQDLEKPSLPQTTEKEAKTNPADSQMACVCHGNFTCINCEMDDAIAFSGGYSQAVH